MCTRPIVRWKNCACSSQSCCPKSVSLMRLRRPKSRDNARSVPNRRRVALGTVYSLRWLRYCSFQARIQPIDLGVARETPPTILSSRCLGCWCDGCRLDRLGHVAIVQAFGCALLLAPSLGRCWHNRPVAHSVRVGRLNDGESDGMFA